MRGCHSTGNSNPSSQPDLDLWTCDRPINRGMVASSGHSHPISRGVVFFIDHWKRPQLAVFKDKDIDITVDTPEVVEGLVHLSLMNFGKRPAKSLQAQFERTTSSGFIPPSWKTLTWVQRDGTRTTKANLGFREPARLELFAYRNLADATNPRKRKLELKIHDDLLSYTYDETSAEHEMQLTQFRIGIYGEDDLEEHLTVTVTVAGPYIDILAGSIRIIRESFAR